MNLTVPPNAHRRHILGALQQRRTDRTGQKVRLVNFADSHRNDWLVVNQFTVVEGQQYRRFSECGGARLLWNRPETNLGYCRARPDRPQSQAQAESGGAGGINTMQDWRR